MYWKVKIFKRPCWAEEITIKTWGRAFSRVSCWRDFEVYDKTGEKIIIATTEWVLIDAKKLSLMRMTGELVDAYGLVDKKVFEEECSGKLIEPQAMEKAYEYAPTRRDIDTNHHVNNVNYLDFAYDVFPKEINTTFNNIEIYYKKQVKLGETISLLYKQEEDVHTVAIKSQDEKSLHAILKFY